MNRGHRVEVTPPESALAAEMFNHFCAAGTMKQILALHREICNTLNLRPNRLPDFYPKLKAKLANSWKAQALFKKFDTRANHKVYGKGRVCSANKVLIIGAGPCGLRAAVECQLLGAKVVVVEKRDRMSRNNVLHLWPFVIQDLRALGAKKFFGKFCAGSIDHISIRQLQCILMKVALLLGVEFHEGVGFEELLEPTITENSETLGWRARVSPPDHPVSQYEFDSLLGADGKRNTLGGFKRKEFRGKLAMAITANFINRHSEQEASVPEISGVAFIFNQKFFKELYEVTGIDLENIVYYKDDTHYFVMTAKKHSLLDKGVLLNDFNDVTRLLSVENVDRSALMRYAQEAARFSTGGRLPLREFALNHYGEPDVALFDFTSMYAAENASMVFERHNRRLLCQLVGDSLLEPFWPTGSGCARGFLSALDAAWAVRSWGQSPTPHPLEVIAERESIYRLLAQTTPENLQRDFGAYTLDPCTRYPNLNRAAVSPHRVTSFYDSDEPLPLDATPSVRKRRREAEIPEEALVSWVGCEGGIRAACGPAALAALVKRYRPELLNTAAVGQVYQVLQEELGITPFASNGSMRDISDAKLRSYLFRVYCAFKGEVPHVQHNSDVFHQIKQSQHNRNTTDHSVSVYSNAAEAEKSQSSCRKKRRSRTPQVSNDPADYIRKKIGKLDLNDITQLAKLIEGHDSINEAQTDKQIQLQEQIIALLDPDESPDPNFLRETLAQLLQGTTKTKHVLANETLSHFFENSSTEKPVKPPRRLKGLDSASIKTPDLSEFLDDSADTDVTVTIQPRVNNSAKKKSFVRSASIDSPAVCHRHSKSPDKPVYRRSNSVDSPEADYSTRRIVQLFEGQRRKYSPIPYDRPVRSERSVSVGNHQMALRMQRMKEIIDGKRQTSPSPEKKAHDVVNIGNAELELRKKRVVDLVHGANLRPVQLEGYQKQSSGEIAFRLQRVNDMMQRGAKSGGKRKAARQIMRQRFEKSLQMLASEPRMEFAPSVDLENDCGLQQYRADAPHFGERVKKLEKKLQHYEEGRLVGAGSRLAGTGARVARLAAELSGTNVPTAVPKASKPKDLMRSVGKIERDDWNVKEIERKIQENRLGRPEPKTAERVPKWDREQFLGRQRRLKEGDAGEEKWGELDETLNKLGQKLRDSGRPDHGTKKVANLATKFVKKEEPQAAKVQAKEECKKCWRGPASTGVQCAACGTRVFAAEGVIADGLHLHRACFRCAVCKSVLRPGNYTMERYGSRLVCLRHSGIAASMSVLDCVHNHTPERISVELSDSGQREIDEDEWTDRNCLPSETSCAKPNSDDEQSSSEEFTDADSDSEEIAFLSLEPTRELRPQELAYFSTDSFGYDDCSDSGGESSGNESCSRMRAAREARRREVPADARPPTDSSEVESDEESEESEEEVSSATEVSTDSEFARDEPHPLPLPTPPAILVTAPNAPHQEYPLSRTRSAGGLATKRALELKRKYLLGEPSPPTVRKSDSTSQIDTKLQAFRSNITEFQKMLHPAPSSAKPVVTFQLNEEKKSQPMPDIIKNLCDDAPVDLLTKVDSPLRKEWNTETVAEEIKEPAGEQVGDLDLDSLSDSTHTETVPNQSVPRVEVHDEGGELIQLDSLMLVNTETEDNDDKASATVTGPTVVAAESESSESCRDATTLAMTETELSDWAAESAVLDDFDDERKRNKNPRTLSGPKVIHDATNIAIASHVCGKTSPEPVVYSNALEHFEFADEGEQDPSLETTVTPRNEGYMELVDDEYDPYSPGNDRSMNFIERSFSETVVKTPTEQICNDRPEISFDLVGSSSDEKTVEVEEVITLNNLKSKEIGSSDKSTSESVVKSESVIKDDSSSNKVEVMEAFNAINLSELSPPLERDKDISEYDTKPKSIPMSTPPEDKSPPLVAGTPQENNNLIDSLKFPSPCSIRVYSPAICRSASVNFDRSSRSTDSPSRSTEMSMSLTLSSGSVSPVSPTPLRETTDKVQEIKREREEQTEVVRRLVLERLGSGRRWDKKSTRRTRVSPSNIPPPVPPPPCEPPPPPPRPAPPLPVTPSFSDPELARDRRRNGIMKSISNYLNRRRGPRHKWVSEPDLTSQELSQHATMSAHKSTGALQEAPPVPPPPHNYRLPDIKDSTKHTASSGIACDADERDAMQLWFEARWARLVAQRRGESPANRRLARLERRLARPLSAEQQAATVAELVQVSAQRDAHQALMAADRRRNAAGGVGD